MAGLRLGPLLRYADWETGGRATVWVEADRPCTAEVRCADGAGGTSPTFRVGGHHYALVLVTGLTPGTSTAYEVLLDGHRVWPLADSRFPDSTIRMPDVPAAGTPPAAVTVSFGSCRWSVPADGGNDPVGPDALDTLAARLAADPNAARPDVLLLLGDQVYADETSEATRRWLAARRDLNEPPGAEVADYQEYTHLYDESWSDPEVRWLLSTVPSCMIFDDHDVIDDWNTSASWLAEMRTAPWWQERILSGLMSYWVYQHLGNLSPAELESDELYAAVRDTPDGTDRLRQFAAAADADPTRARWSYRRDFGRTRLLMLDSRAARVLEERNRSMLNAGEARWVREQALTEKGSYDHLLIGTSLPWLLPPLIHDAEGWNAALCRGERGGRWARFGEDLRRRSDLEHWAAFPASFEELTHLIAEVGSGEGAPATVCVLSGDVHHAYVAEPAWSDGTQPDAQVLQLTCSPVHNSIPTSIRLGFRFGWSRMGRRIGRALARHGRLGTPPIGWRKTGGPWFGNQLMTLMLRGRSASLRLDQARTTGSGQSREARLVTVQERELTAARDPSHSGG
ncbi:alkaline phosphatase family protein [Streptomyces sp. NBC_01142]|uniref:alkaline phosphatase D family protein n=1 Tax=Streptomyces sp. NBC_01142 TaxID=2975865 RepID=UPI002252BC48|nr:alkaline phosphatase D family protein [Streptomyces sp. NBC_01142]MCX4822797.1 alkaline phosphatase family protein [Streptomyces sp. NBC_01142]